MKNWTPATDVRLAELRDARYTVAGIADELGFSVSWIEQKITKLGLRKKALNGEGKHRKSRAKPVERGPAADASRPAYVPAGLETTDCVGYPGFDVRFQCAPGTRVLGGFASAGIGRYLDDERGGRA